MATIESRRRTELNMDCTSLRKLAGEMEASFLAPAIVNARWVVCMRWASSDFEVRIASLERNYISTRSQMVDFIERCILGGFPTVPTGRGLLLDADPGLRPPRRTCPGLLSKLPTGEEPLPVSSIAGRQRRWTTDKKTRFQFFCKSSGTVSSFRGSATQVDG